jgi:hypothetical protein
LLFVIPDGRLFLDQVNLAESIVFSAKILSYLKGQESCVSATNMH